MVKQRRAKELHVTILFPCGLCQCSAIWTKGLRKWPDISYFSVLVPLTLLVYHFILNLHGTQVYFYPIIFSYRIDSVTLVSITVPEFFFSFADLKKFIWFCPQSFFLSAASGSTVQIQWRRHYYLPPAGAAVSPVWFASVWFASQCGRELFLGWQCDID